MFNKRAFANSAAITSALIFLVFRILSLLSPLLFDFLHRCQLQGADAVQPVPHGFFFMTFVKALAAIVVFAWIFGYLWADLYNRFSK